MEEKVGPVQVLLQRRQILEAIAQLGRLCNWKESDIEDLLAEVWIDLVRIDNSAFKFVQKTGNELEARDFWTQGMTDLQYWLSLVLGVELDFMF